MQNVMAFGILKITKIAPGMRMV